MLEYFFPHVELNLCSHDMTVIAYKIIAETLYKHERGHDGTQHKNSVQNLVFWQKYNRPCNIADDQGNHKCSGRPQKSKKHIRRKNPLKWFIITKKFTPFKIFFLFHLSISLFTIFHGINNQSSSPFNKW